MKKNNVRQRKRKKQPSISKKKVLIIDDNPGILDAMRLVFETAGYAVEVTIDGNDALRLKNPLPHIIFLDILLSGTDGCSICKSLKSDHKTRYIPIIMISANRNVHAITSECGADGYVEKPFEITTLLDMAEKYTSA